MQKLEEILHAEDSARHAVSDAQTEAARIAQEASAEAHLIRASAKRDTDEKARVEREALLAGAAEDARAIEAAAETERAALIVRAEGRLARATDVLLRELAG